MCLLLCILLEIKITSFALIFPFGIFDTAKTIYFKQSSSLNQLKEKCNRKSGMVRGRVVHEASDTNTKNYVFYVSVQLLETQRVPSAKM